MADKEIKVKLTTEADMSDLEDLKDTVEETTQSAKDLSDELQNIDTDVDTTSVEELTENLDESKESTDELNQNLENIDGSNISGVSDSTKQLSDDLSGAAEQANSLADSLGLIESATWQSMAEGMNSYSSSAESLATEMNNAAISVGQLAIQAGVTEDQMVSLINYISNETFPQEEAMAYVQALNQMGVSASSFADAATDMDRINDAFGIGASNVIKLTQGLRALGIDADHLSESYNALAYAQSNVVGGVDTYTSVVQKNGAALREMGLNADQVAVILARLSDRGLSNKQIIKEMASAVKEADGDVRKLEEALGLEAGALDNASAETAKYEGQVQQLADEEMEHKTMTERVKAALDDLALSANGAISPFVNLGTVFTQVGSWVMTINHFKTLSDTIGLTGKKSDATAVSLGTRLKTALITAGTYAKSAAVSFGTMLKNALVAAGTAAKNAIIWIANAGKAALTAGYNALRAAAMWLYEKLQVAASAIVKAASVVPTLLLAAAEWALASPILLVVAAVLIFIGVMWYLYNTNESVRNAINGFGQTLMNLGQTIFSVLSGAFAWLQGAWENTVNFFQTYGQTFLETLFVILTGPIGAIGLLISNFLGMPTQIGGALQNALTRVVSWGSSIVSNITSTATRSVNNFMTQIRSLPGKFMAELQRMLSAVNEWAASLPAKFWQAGVNAVKNFLNALGIHSPGIMQTSLIAEMENTGKRIPAASRRLITNVGNVGNDIVSAFGDPGLNLGFNNGTGNTVTGNQPVTYVFNLYGDIDNEERMEKFIEAVRRELSWNNNLAGRTV